MDEKTEILLNEYLDGTLSEDQQREVESLLSESADARQYFTELQQLFGNMSTLDEVPLPRDFSQTVVASIEAEGDVASEAVSYWWLIAQMIGAGVLLIFAWPVLQAGLTEIGTAVSINASTVSLSFISEFWQQLRDGLTAVTTTPSNFSGLGLNPVQLTWLLASTFLVWILSNGYLLSNESE